MIGAPELPLVSVIIPTRNRPALLVRAVQSALDQTWTALEVLVILDGPCSATEAALAGLTDKRLRVLRNAASIGPGPARNHAACQARGEWLAFLDDDDWWLPHKLARQIGTRSPAAPVVLSCLCRVESPDGVRILPRRLPAKGERVDDYLLSNPFGTDAYIATPTLVLPRLLFQRTGFGDTRQHEDTTLLLRAQAQGALFIMQPEVLAVIQAGGADSLGTAFPWTDAMLWLDAEGALLSRRAYAGVCLVTAASMAARQRRWRAAPSLALRALRHGAPTAAHWLAFALIWGVPPRARRLLRAWIARHSRPCSIKIQK